MTEDRDQISERRRKERHVAELINFRVNKTKPKKWRQQHSLEIFEIFRFQQGVLYLQS
jgi:hypothetical protein